MEDSAQDLFDDENNKYLKKISRDGLKYLADKNFLENVNTYVRVNSKKSIFYKKDIETIKDILKNGSKINGIFLPKVENHNQVKDCYEQLSNSNSDYISIVPMIETKKGLENLDHILLEDRSKNMIKYVHYGHYDFCLENNLWPFPEPYHFEYWKIVNEISKKVIRHKKKYIHTPFPLINNENLYWSSINYLSKSLGDDEINISLVNINTGYINENKNAKQFKLKNMSNDNHYKKVFAEKIVNEYLKSKSKKKSFSLSRKRFIPPHLYLGASKFLDIK